MLNSPEADLWLEKFDSLGEHLRAYFYYHTIVNHERKHEIALKLWGSMACCSLFYH